MSINKHSGFSLVELMIVVSIIGIWATMALPLFRGFQAAARQTEVKTTLNHLFTLQENYQMERNTYLDFPTRYGRLADGNGNCDFTIGGAELLGFQISPCVPGYQGFPRYGYWAGVTSPSWRGWGSSATIPHQNIFVGCVVSGVMTPYDIWRIDETKQLLDAGTFLKNCNGP